MRLTFNPPAPCTANLADDTRTITGVIVPYGVAGNTSLGRLAVKAGSLSWPDDLTRVKLTREHDRTAPRGYGLSATDAPDGLSMAFRAARTPDGDDALLEASEHVRDGLSVDLDDVEVRAGVVVAGRVVAVGQVAVPAFETARIAASDDPPDSPGDDPQPTEDEDTVPELDTAPATEPVVPEQMTAAAVPANLPVPSAAAPGQIQTMADLYRALTAAHQSMPSRSLQAALVNITHTANKWAQATQYEGELWDGVDYQRVIVPLISSGTLTGYTVSGWKWSDPPTVAAYAGDKTAVPSDTAATVAVSQDAKRLAGAHDIDRKFRDFNDTAFFESYYRAMAASYAMESDKSALADLQAAATAFTQVAGAGAWPTIVAMSMSLGVRGPASFALVGSAVALSLAGTTTANAPADLSVVGGLPTVIYSPLLAAGAVLVGNRAGATFHELPGSPIRVEAIDMVNGGIDAGVFGYYATVIHSPLAFAKTTFTAPAEEPAA